MHLGAWLTVLTIGIASNLDNAGVGIAYGVQRIRIGWLPNVVIAVVSLLGTLVAGLIGGWLSHIIAPFIDNLVGAVVIIGVGVGVLCQPWLSKRNQPQPGKGNVVMRILQHPEAGDVNQNNQIGIVESLLIGTALAMNALAGGFDAGITRQSIWATSLAVGVFSYVLLGLAAYLGRRYAAERFGNRATVAAGLLLILVGIHQFL